MIKTFSEWLRVREDTGVAGGLPYGAETTPPTSTATQPVNNANPQINGLVGVPPHIVQQLQRTGPAMQNILNVANQSVKLGKHRDITAALQAAMAEYNPAHGQEVMAHQAGMTAPAGSAPQPIGTR